MVSLEGIMITSDTEAQEIKYMATIDIPVEYSHTDSDE